MTSAVTDVAPSGASLVEYDEANIKVYLRLLDAAATSAKWEEVAHSVLGVDAQLEPARARRCYDSHLARAKWIADGGYLDLLRFGKA